MCMNHLKLDTLRPDWLYLNHEKYDNYRTS